MATVGILLYDGVEVLDGCGPFEVFTTAARVALRGGRSSAPFDVQTIAVAESTVTARGGLQLVAATTVADHPVVDILVVPGGLQEKVERDDAVVEWVRRTASGAALTASVCTGAFVLAAAGILDGRAATSHWEDVDDLERRYPAVRVRRGVRWVDDGDVVTSAGISAGIDMSLHLVCRQEGEGLARATARQMEYAWTADPV